MPRFDEGFHGEVLIGVISRALCTQGAFLLTHAVSCNA